MTKTSQKILTDDELHLKADQKKSSTPMPSLTPQPDSGKQSEEKRKKEEEELKADLVICNNCGVEGHTSASCFKPKK